MASRSEYRKFKTAVLRNCGHICENMHCDADANQVHHFLKQSTYPEFKIDPDNGMGICGSCHSELERRMREGEDWLDLIPIDRVILIKEKAGII